MGNEPLGLQQLREGDTARVVATGELDLSSAGDLRAAAREAREGARRLEIDLCGLEFIDSTGLSALLDIRHETASAGVTLAVLVGEGPIRDAVEHTGLRELLAV